MLLQYCMSLALDGVENPFVNKSTPNQDCSPSAHLSTCSNRTDSYWVPIDYMLCHNTPIAGWHEGFYPFIPHKCSSSLEGKIVSIDICNTGTNFFMLQNIVHCKTSSLNMGCCFLTGIDLYRMLLLSSLLCMWLQSAYNSSTGTIVRVLFHLCISITTVASSSRGFR